MSDVEEITLYVATDGNDQWSGTLPEPNAAGTDGPLATLTGARDAIRRMKSDGPLQQPVTVQLRGGVYQLREPFTLTPQDSGSEQAPVTYAAYPGEKPVISGGQQITGWRKGEGELWITEISGVKSGAWYFRQLFINGQRRDRTRLPEQGYYELAERPPEEERVDPESLKFFKFKPGDITEWTNRDDAEVVVLRYWDEARLHIESVDYDDNVVTFTTPSTRLFAWGPEKAPYYIENIPEGLTRPGQWYLDRQTGILTYWPLPDEDMTQVEALAPVIEELVRLSGDWENAVSDRANRRYGAAVEFVALRGLAFAHTSWSLGPEGYPGYQAESELGAAISANGVDSFTIKDCDISHIGLYAIELARACNNNRIIGNHIHDIGAGGIKIGEGVIRANDDEMTTGNVVSDNFIYDLGRVHLCGVGVLIRQSAKNVISHNSIHDLYYTAISVGWTWGYGPSASDHNIIEYNHLYNIGNILGDMGGVYVLGIQPGTRVCYNLVHDVVSSPHAYGGWGLYTDQGSTGIVFENNVVYNTSTGGFHHHFGKEDIIRNNIFAFSSDNQLTFGRPEDHLSFTYENNIFYFDNGKLLLVNKEAWNNGRFKFDENIYFDASGAPLDFAGKSWSEWQQSGQDIHSLVADPLFVDAENRDFRLKPESPAFELGFEPIDLSDVGPRVEGYADLKEVRPPFWASTPEDVPEAPEPGEREAYDWEQTDD